MSVTRGRRPAEACDARQGASPPLIEFRRSGHGGQKHERWRRAASRALYGLRAPCVPGHCTDSLAQPQRLGWAGPLAPAPVQPARRAIPPPADPSGGTKMVPSPASDWPGGRRRGLRSLVPRSRARKPHCELGTEQAPW